VEAVSGRFYVDRRERECRFRNERNEEELWALCEQMTGTRARDQSTSSTTLPKPSLLAT